jgi:hypothetical protein
MYLFKSCLDYGLTGSPTLIKLFIGMSEVARGRIYAFVIGFELAEEGGPNLCFRLTQSFA